MSKVIAIIGSGYGDEGKGLMTDYHSSQHENAIVVRSNGGAQAGHTVVTPEGDRHVFSHFGSGSLNGSSTYLSEHFVANPTLFEKEYKLYTEQFGEPPKIYLDALSIFSTPYDMLLNQRVETMRGHDAHGSCGVGFGETLERQLISGAYNIKWLDDILHLTSSQFDEYLYIYLDEIRKLYVPKRINLNKVSEPFLEILNNDSLISAYIESCRFMMEHVTITRPHVLKNNTIIFESAQGLLLDMDYGYFPHVTRSNCGMKNISSILQEVPGEHDITANYITRAYTTRHGAGPLNNEDMGLVDRHNIIDDTNIPNEFQGSLRFAPLDLDLFNSVTDKDFLNYADRSARKTTTITCLDQLIGETTWYAKNTKRFMSADVVRNRAGEIFNYGSFGPTREDIIKFDK